MNIEELIDQNKEDLLRDEEVMKKNEKRIEEKYS
ncbi:FbpB family small basic protein [Lentibacillus lipolyticus]|nr:FbpB family small basic protein [Lentibacillus lipolyticus]